MNSFFIPTTFRSKMYIRFGKHQVCSNTMRPYNYKVEVSPHRIVTYIRTVLIVNLNTDYTFRIHTKKPNANAIGYRVHNYNYQLISHAMHETNTQRSNFRRQTSQRCLSSPRSVLVNYQVPSHPIRFAYFSSKVSEPSPHNRMCRHKA